MQRKLLAVTICLVLLLLANCGFKHSRKYKIETQPPKDHTDTNNVSYSIWATYWHTKDLKYEIEQLGEHIENICYFAAYFDMDEKLFIPDGTKESLKKIKGFSSPTRYRNFLTIVNDLILEDGTASLKDVRLLYTLFETQESMENHIREILEMATKEGFTGVEIDYEGIKKDMKLWGFFDEFVKRLYLSACKKNLPVRIVLEPDTPFDEILLPKGPEYVVMCYNLHGYGSVPGPKANIDFIEDIIKKAANLPGRVDFAFATGGYDFQNDGTVAAITEREAVELLKIYNKSATRDKSSHALSFNYTDGEGMYHEVWYGDKNTLESWINIVQAAGYCNISLWKIGGNLDLGI